MIFKSARSTSLRHLSGITRPFIQVLKSSQVKSSFEVCLRTWCRQHQPGLNTNAAPYVPVYTQALQYFSSDSFITSTHEDESMLPSQEISFSTSANIRTRSVSAGYPPQSAPFAQAIARRTHSTGCVDNGEHIERHGHSPIHDILADEDWQHHHFETVLKEESQSPRGTLQSWMQPVMSRVYQELDNLNTSRLPTLKLCQKIVLKLAKNFGVLPDGFEIDVEPPEANRFPTGNGGFADIYVVRRRDTMEPVCLKRLRLFDDQSQEQRDSVRRSFCHEAVLWKNLRHQNVLPFLGVNTNPAVCGPSFALISPFLSNGNIMSYMRRTQNFDPFKAVKEIADGLDYLHTCQTPIIHGDIKGANILVNDVGVCCICDFGLSIVTETYGISVATASSHLKGSAPWMAPELFTEARYMPGEIKPDNRPRDIYAFGCTMLEIFSGKAPWWEYKHLIPLLMDVKEGKRPRRPSQPDAPLLSDGLWKVIERCWAQDPATRLNTREIALLLSFYPL